MFKTVVMYVISLQTGIATVFWASILRAPRPNPGLDTGYPAVVLMDVKSSFLSSYTKRT